MGGNCIVVIRGPGLLVKAGFMQSKRALCTTNQKNMHAKQARNFSITFYVNIWSTVIKQGEIIVLLIQLLTSYAKNEVSLLGIFSHWSSIHISFTS